MQFFVEVNLFINMVKVKCMLSAAQDSYPNRRFIISFGQKYMPKETANNQELHQKLGQKQN